MRKNMMALPATFLIQFSRPSTGRNNDSLGSDRRAVIGEGADARQTPIQRTGYRGASQHESEGKKEAEGSHSTVSGVFAAGAGRRFRSPIDNHAVFPHVCAKAENGFVGQENCFAAAAARNNWPKNSMISVKYGQRRNRCRGRAGRVDRP
jgi:hypothetical protein